MLKNKNLKIFYASLLCAAISIPSAMAGNFHHYKPRDISIEPIGTYASGIFDESAAEISAYDAKTARVFVTNFNDNSIDVLDISNPTAPTFIFAIDLNPYGAGPNSVAVKRGVVAVAVEADPKQDPGFVVFFDTDGNLLNQVTVGSLPDMLTFSPNGKFLVVANEGEPNDEYTEDPEGTISIIRMRRNIGKISDADIRTADFTQFNDEIDSLRDSGIRIFGPGATVAQDLEPEYLTVTKDSRKAVVTLQENNALAIVDLKKAQVTDLLPLGTKDHSLEANALDASNRDDAINITTWPAKGMYMPDAIASYKVSGNTYIVTANEGDARDYDGYSEEVRVKDLPLDPDAFPDAATLQLNENLGRLKTTTANGDTDGDSDFDEIYSYGARSFSIWNMKGELIFDSGSEFEDILADALPDDFNATNDENNSFDDRSDDKGAEPEALALGKIAGRTYAYIGLERIGGIMVYDISNPRSPRFVEYVNNRDFSGNPAAGTAGDLAPEGIVFVPAGKSPINQPLLIVTNEVSGTTTVYKINR